jgi:outer membrane protein
MCGRDNGSLFKRLKSLGLSCVLLVALGVAAQETLTLGKALEIAEKSSYSAEMGALDKQLAAQDIKQSLALYYPRIDASMGHVHLDNDPAFKFGATSFPAGEQLFWKWDFSVQQTIWDFGRRKEILKASENSENAVKARVSQEVRLKQAEIAAFFMDALTIKDQIEVVDVRKRSLGDHLKTAQSLYDQGVVTRNELLRTEVALRSLDDQSRKLESAYDSALDQLSKCMGVDLARGILLSDPTASPSQDMPRIVWSKEEIMARALGNSEGLKALDENIQALTNSYNFARKDYYPYFVGSAGHSYEQNRYMAYPHVNKFFLGVSVNLFDGGTRKARVVKSQIEIEKAKREKLEAEREVADKILKAYREYNDALEEYNTAKLNVNSSSENLRIVEDQYKEGILKTTDFLEAETLFAESRFKEVESLHKVVALEAEILAVMSEDLKAFFADKN